MYQVACKDMGMDACPFVAEGETVEAAMGMLSSHGMEMHKDAMEKMMAEGMTADQMAEKMKAVAKMV
jgi:predicted small metal-binding protein